MTDTTNQDNSTPQDELEVEESGVTVDLSAREAQVRLAVSALREAEQQVRILQRTINNLQGMLPTVNSIGYVDASFVPFAHVTKDVRNKMLELLSENLAATEDAVRASFRAVKSVKRSRLSEEQIDKLVMNADLLILQTLQPSTDAS